MLAVDVEDDEEPSFTMLFTRLMSGMSFSTCPTEAANDHFLN